jgi:AhpD family alkylhydroperoxidase
MGAAMGGILIRTALRRSLAQIAHVSAIRPGQARDLVARVYQQVERDFGMLAPPVALHSPAPPTLAACWLMLRESLVVPGLTDRDTKEAVATAVSLSNVCPYCVDVHSMTLEALGRKVAEDPKTDVRVRRIADWARASATPETADLRETPFPAEHAPELIGVVVTFHYINRMVNVFLPDTPLPSGVPPAAQGRALRLLGRFMRSSTTKDHRPGESLDLLPAAPLPPDLVWAAGNQYVADAFARAAAATDAAGARSVPASVRALVLHELAEWDGQPPGLSRAWVTDAVSALPAADRAAGRLALLTALASHQLDPTVIEDFRMARPDDRSLVELTSWASMAAARRVGSWIPAGRRVTRRVVETENPTGK